MGVVVKVNTTKMVADLKAYYEDLLRYSEQALEQAGQETLNQGQALAPVDEGALEESGSFSASRRGDSVTLSVSMGEGLDYAVRQHEDQSLQLGEGTKAKPGTKYGAPGRKFLERAAHGLAADGYFQKKIIEAINKIRSRG